VVEVFNFDQWKEGLELSPLPPRVIVRNEEISDKADDPETSSDDKMGDIPR
jgi:hypothetical protein